MKKENDAVDLGQKIKEAEVKNILQKLKNGKTLTARESKIVSEFAAEKNGGKLTQRDIAKAWGMTQPNVHKMVKMGMPTHSMQAAEEWRKEFLAQNGRGDAAPKGLNEARLRKLKLECERIEFANAIDRGEYVKIVDQRESGIKIGAILSAKLSALVNDASGILAGLGEVEVKKIMQERTQIILAEFKEELAKII